MLKIYNTLTRQKQDFTPINPGKVGMYVCGPTVYDFIHIGNARTFTVFDMVYRWLGASGYAVNYVRNVTDVDDKIITRAAENKEPIDALTARMTAAMEEDCARLGMARPTEQPHATQYVTGDAHSMVAMIQALIDKGLAYAPGNGDVNYEVRKFPGYGKLSGKSLDDLRAGERVAVDANKRDPMDFVLWKAAKPGEPFWPSPWGNGRPGWHIECSVMSEATLGERFDIHGGGEDLTFPHHENEIAQSEGAHGHGFANYWMHARFLNIDNTKMSKSLGNFFTLRDVLNQPQFRGREEAVRFFLLRGHYRSQTNYTEKALKEAEQNLTTMYISLKDFGSVKPGKIDWSDEYATRFRAAMDDDFNTPEAFAVLFDVAKELNKNKSEQKAMLLKSLGGTLGLLQGDANAYLQGGGIHITGNLSMSEITSNGQIAFGLGDDEIQTMIDGRIAARKSKNFAESDRI
ncbi:MAG: cysteine--tRNA ligase, partial [Burkholderiales bacterium]